MNLFTWLFLGAIVIGYAIEFWLARRQQEYVKANIAAVPKAFADNVSLQDHQKAARYTLAKLQFGNYSQIISNLLLVGWTLGGALQWLYQQVAMLGLTSSLQGTVLILSAMLLMSLLELPLSVWNTFVLEQRFGFNRETPQRFMLDQLINLALMLVIGAPLIWVILVVMQSSGTLWWLYAWLLWMGFTLLMTWAFPTWIAPLFNKFTPLENGELRELLGRLLQRCGFADNGMFVMDGSRRSSHGNAYFTGFGKNKRIVFFDTLLTQLTPHETEAVLAHELGHFKRRHILKRLLAMAVLTLAGFALLGWLKQQPWFYQGLGVQSQDDALALLLFVLALPVFSFFFQPLNSWISRQQEFEADDFATEQSNPQNLITALVKLYRDNANTLTPDPLYSAFHHSHPPAPVRIANISSKIQTTQ